MTQKVFFTREAVLAAAFAITREQGWAAVTARSIARRLGSSTMPIYSSLRSMEEIEPEIRAMAEESMHEYQSRRYTDNAAVDLAVGYVTFAREESNLFRFLYVDRPRRLGPAEAERQAAGLAQSFGASAGLKKLMESIPELLSNPLVLNIWIYTHGLASLLSSGALTLPEDRIRELLANAGGAFAAQLRGGKERRRA